MTIRSWWWISSLLTKTGSGKCQSTLLMRILSLLKRVSLLRRSLFPWMRSDLKSKGRRLRPLLLKLLSKLLKMLPIRLQRKLRKPLNSPKKLPKTPRPRLTKLPNWILQLTRILKKSKSKLKSLSLKCQRKKRRRRRKKRRKSKRKKRAKLNRNKHPPKHLRWNHSKILSNFSMSMVLNFHSLSFWKTRLLKSQKDIKKSLMSIMMLRIPITSSEFEVVK